jgi:hypothetical protein
VYATEGASPPDNPADTAGRPTPGTNSLEES